MQKQNKPIVKLIENFENDESLTQLEKEVINNINNNPRDFLFSKNIKTFCLDNGIVETTIQRIAKKLDYSSSLEMKNKLTIKLNNFIYKEKENIINMLDKKVNYEILRYFNFIERKATIMDWNTIDKMKNSFLENKTIYIYQNDSLFSYYFFEKICEALHKNIIRIENKNHFDLIKSGINENVFLIITNPFGEINEFENTLIDFFKLKNKEIYYITSTFKKITDINLLILDIENNLNKNDDLFNKNFYFKILYDQMVNIITMSLIKELNKQK
ncbi:hypothetical protein [Malacoplasma penetrans]|nr:hypothetical protein [Malacoplasma penetrans]